MRIQFQRWYGASMAASTSIAPAVASSSLRVKPRPSPMAVSSGWWISPRRVLKLVQTTMPAATPTKATRSNDLMNSATASGPYRRLSPLIGFMRLMSGIIALADQRRPPITTGARKLASRQTSTSGAITHISCSSRSPKWPNSAFGC
ncbi:hypothetical protein D3C73_985520 [compost metagenome]